MVVKFCQVNGGCGGFLEKVTTGRKLTFKCTRCKQESASSAEDTILSTKKKSAADGLENYATLIRSNIGTASRHLIDKQCVHCGFPYCAQFNLKGRRMLFCDNQACKAGQ
jgi:ribosomal protein L37E